MIRRTSPLPARRKREKMGIERGPKRVWLRHRKFVRSRGCVVPGCAAPAEFAHIRSAANAGTGLKPHDAFAIGLCRTHHQEQHQCGQGSFEDRHQLDLEAIAAAYVTETPDRRMWLSLLESDDAALDPLKPATLKGRAAGLIGPSPADSKPVMERARVIDLIAGLPRFIPIYAARFPFTDHRTQAEVFAEETAAKAKARA